MRGGLCPHRTPQCPPSSYCKNICSGPTSWLNQPAAPRFSSCLPNDGEDGGTSRVEEVEAVGAEQL